MHYSNGFFKKTTIGAGKMTQWLKTWDALPEDQA